MNSPLWFYNLGFWSAQVALLVLAAGFLPRLLQIRQPRIVLACWRALLAISLVLPFIQPWHRPQVVPAASVAPATVPANFLPQVTPAITQWHFLNLQIIAQLIGVIILVGIAARFVILALGLFKPRQFRQASAPISSFPESAALLEEMRSQVSTRADFRLSSYVNSPVTFGFAAPVILLPESFPSKDSRFQSAIACHELLHVRRHDWAHHLAEEIIRAIFWFHPAIAWLIARVRLAREQVVDLEVVTLTNARNTYLEALLEFTGTRDRATAVPAPLFLAERQLAERITVMLKEVRMSRTRLIASLTVIACCVAFAITLGVWTFPLKAAPLPAQSKPTTGIPGGVSSGVSGGATGGASSAVARGVSGGITGAVSGGIKSGIPDGIGGQPADEGSVDRNSIWIDTVKKGAMPLQVRGSGTLVRAQDSQNLIARVSVPTSMSTDVRPDQTAIVDTRKGIVKAHVMRIGGSPFAETRSVDLAFDGPLPQEATVDLAVDATIDIGKLDNVLYIHRPVHSAASAARPLFKIVDNGAGAQRVYVKFGRASVQTIEVLAGLKEGDKVILSDMSNWENVERVHLK